MMLRQKSFSTKAREQNYKEENEGQQKKKKMKEVKNQMRVKKNNIELKRRKTKVLYVMYKKDEKILVFVERKKFNSLIN